MFTLEVTLSKTAPNRYDYTVTTPNHDTYRGGGPDYHIAWERGTKLINKLKDEFSVVVVEIE